MVVSLRFVALLGLLAAGVAGCDGTVSTSAAADPKADAVADAGGVAPSAPIAGFVPVEPSRSCPSPAPEWHCLTPWPSNFHRAEKPSGGARITLPKQGVPTTEDGERVDWITPAYRDGAAILPQIVAQIPGGIDDANLVGPDGAYDRSLSPSKTPSLILDTVTGEAVPHFAEIDPVPEKVDDRALILRPLRPLQWGRRYVVVVQRLRHPGGSIIAPSPTFDRIFNEKATER